MMRDATKILKKYTGLQLDPELLWDPNGSAVTRQLAVAIEEVNSIERELVRAAFQLRELADKIESSVDAGPGETYRSLNPHGELQGNSAGRVEILIASHSERIGKLKLLATLYKIENGITGS